MPNWCNNVVEIRGKFSDLERLRDLLKGESDFDFTKVAPEPVEYDKGDPERLGSGNIDDAFPDWYKWRVANWGTKWNNSGDDTIVSFEHIGNGNVGCLTYSFDTAWGPCEPIIEKLAGMFPTLDFAHSWDEPGMNFGGYKVYNKGDLDRAEQGDSRSSTWANQAEYALDEIVD